MSERGIGPGQPHPAAPPRRRGADAGTAGGDAPERFRRLMSGARKRDADAETAGAVPLPPGPASPQPKSSSPRPDPVAPSAGSGVPQLLIADDDGPPRRVCVRFPDATMRGVSAEVFENGGAWVAAFVCADDTAFALLRAHAGRMAREMANALRRRTVWRVAPATGDPSREVHEWADPDCEK